MNKDHHLDVTGAWRQNNPAVTDLLIPEKAWEYSS